MSPALELEMERRGAWNLFAALSLISSRSADAFKYLDHILLFSVSTSSKLCLINICFSMPLPLVLCACEFEALKDTISRAASSFPAKT